MKHIFEAIPPHDQAFYYHFDRMRIIFGELIYLPLLWLIFKTFKSKFQERDLFLLVWILVPYVFFSFVQTKMQGYILFCAPAIFILTAIFFEYLWTLKIKYFAKAVAILLLLLPIRYSIERIKPFSDIERSAVWITEIKSLDKNDSNPKKVIFNNEYPIETMFHTDFIAYEKVPEITKLRDLRQEGYSIYIDNQSSIHEELKGLSFVKYVHITGEK